MLPNDSLTPKTSDFHSESLIFIGIGPFFGNSCFLYFSAWLNPLYHFLRFCTGFLYFLRVLKMCFLYFECFERRFFLNCLNKLFLFFEFFTYLVLVLVLKKVNIE